MGNEPANAGGDRGAHGVVGSLRMMSQREAIWREHESPAMFRALIYPANIVSEVGWWMVRPIRMMARRTT